MTLVTILVIDALFHHFVSAICLFFLVFMPAKAFFAAPVAIT